MINQFFGETRWLSNFHRVDVELGGQIYPTTEHAYQAAKSLNHEVREAIRLCSTPRDAKNLGQLVQLRGDWEQVKFKIMLNLQRQKFANEPLRGMLLATGDQELVEGNRWHDNYWGSCRCDKCKDEGLNLLGRAIMIVRSRLTL